MALCDPCDRWFRTDEAYLQHMRSSSAHPWWCNLCERDFNSHNALSSHRANSSRHDWCSICSREFRDRQELNEHDEDEHPECARCNIRFRNNTGLHEHRRQVHPAIYCVDCKQMFMAPANYQAHRNSSIHMVKNVPCLAGCRLKFVSTSAMTLHMESGSCSSGVNRASLNREVARRDTSGLITTDRARRLLTYDGEESPVVYTTTQRSWNGSAWECRLCGKLHTTQRGLEQYLNSLRHLQPAGALYRCPGCRDEFSALSGLVQHIERTSRCQIRQNAQVSRTIMAISNPRAIVAY